MRVPGHMNSEFQTYKTRSCRHSVIDERVKAWPNQQSFSKKHHLTGTTTFSGRWRNPISGASHQAADVVSLIASQVSPFWADQHLLDAKHDETRAFEGDVDG